ncbi:MAG: NAD-dependent epimerase/dehydratase family protein [Myxococcaceae bacterium]
MSTIFVTGGSGFLGRHLLPFLTSHGEKVRALARSEKSAEQVRALGAEAAFGDLNDVAKLTEGMRGCEVVVHAAASTAEWGPYSEFYESNVTGTQNVLAAAKAAGVKRFVHVSTEAVLLDGSPLVKVDETRPLPAKAMGPYAETKNLAEREALAAPGIEVVVVRPRFIWGKGDTTLLPKLVEMVKRGQFAWISHGEALTSTCHVDNVCEGIWLAAHKGQPGAIYFLTDGNEVKVRDFLTALLGTQGVTPSGKSVPFGLALFFATLVEAVWRLFGLKSHPPLQRTSVILIGQEVTVSDARARRELGYTAQVTREQGLAELKGR